MKHFCYQERHVADDNDYQWLHDPDMIGEPRRQAASEAGQNANHSRPANDDKEGNYAIDDIDNDNIIDTNHTESLEHLVQHLQRQ